MQLKLKKILYCFIASLMSQASFSLIKVDQFETLYSPREAVQYKNQICFLTESFNAEKSYLEFYDLSFHKRLKQKVCFNGNVRTIKVIEDKIYALATKGEFSGIRQGSKDKYVYLIGIEGKSVKDFTVLGDYIYVIHDEFPGLTKISLKTSKVEEAQQLSEQVKKDQQPSYKGVFNRIFSYNGALLLVCSEATHLRNFFPLPLERFPGHPYYLSFLDPESSYGIRSRIKGVRFFYRTCNSS